MEMKKKENGKKWKLKNGKWKWKINEQKINGKKV